MDSTEIANIFLNKMGLPSGSILLKACGKRPKATIEDFVILILEYHSLKEISEIFGCSTGTLNTALRKLFDFKLTGRQSWRWKILTVAGLGNCTSCCSIKPIEDFPNNSNNSSGKHTVCKNCSKAADSFYRVEKAARYRTCKVNATPPWANKDLIKDIYANCPLGYEVDHIIPLRGSFVSGLHVPENLQYLTQYDNRRKSNKFHLA